MKEVGSTNRRHWVGVWSLSLQRLDAIVCCFFFFAFQLKFYQVSVPFANVHGFVVWHFGSKKIMLNVKTKSSTIYDEDESYKSVLITNKEKYFIKPLSTKSDGKNDIYVNFGAGNKSKILAEALKKKSNSENCCFPIARRRCRSESPPPPLLTDISTITQTAKLRTSRPENSAKCKKLLKCNGYSNKVSGVLIFISIIIRLIEEVYEWFTWIKLIQ